MAIRCPRVTNHSETVPDNFESDMRRRLLPGCVSSDARPFDPLPPGPPKHYGCWVGRSRNPEIHRRLAPQQERASRHEGKYLLTMGLMVPPRPEETRDSQDGVAIDIKDANLEPILGAWLPGICKGLERRGTVNPVIPPDALTHIRVEASERRTLIERRVRAARIG